MKKGDVKTIANMTMGGEVISEGKAILVKKLMPKRGNHEYWTVRFIKDNTLCDRWVKT
jgi:hypothetical protein